jgi:ISXO2-like transposase domain
MRILPSRSKASILIFDVVEHRIWKSTNRKADRADRRTAEERKRQVVVVAREFLGRTLPFVVPRESAGVPLIRQNVPSGTTVHADECAACVLSDAVGQPSPRVQGRRRRLHKEAESWSSRLRRAEFGIHHPISGECLDQYANERGAQIANRLML